ncbi:MAG: ATP-binding cassette domain-containing protein [Cocleimonas sp.]|nr:ATP-binding cassette domain-containing protein [Cocleimonas sp.]
MSEIVLSLKEFGVAFNKRIILSAINLELPETGVTTLMGPSGTGKSTLLRAIAGLSTTNPAYRTWGSIHYLGNDLSQTMLYPALVAQNIKLMIASVLENIVDGLPERRTLDQSQQRELAKRLLIAADLECLCHQLDTAVIDLKLADQRQLAILRQLAVNPRLVCIDEPTVGLADDEVARLLNYLKREAKQRAILIVTHNQQVAKTLGGQTALLASGWIQEIQPTVAFFDTPLQTITKTFVETGSCGSPSPDAKPEHVAPEWVAALRPPPKAAMEYKSHVLGPNGFLWLKKGQLAGTPRPGLLHDIEYDLMALKRVGVTHLVSLTLRPLDADLCQKHQIDLISSPIVDMQAPSEKQALALNQHIATLLKQQKTIAIHCRAGLGRTGTLLASQLIYEGDSALSALETTRNIERRWVQSEAQVDFLSGYEQFLKQQH